MVLVQEELAAGWVASEEEELELAASLLVGEVMVEEVEELVIVLAVWGFSLRHSPVLLSGFPPWRGRSRVECVQLQLRSVVEV